MSNKTSLTAEKFLAEAKPIMVEINGAKVVGKPIAFKTGSFGYNASGKVPMEVAGEVVTLQVAANLIVVGSKPETAEKPAKAKKAA
jgi:hypothetical protein